MDPAFLIVMVIVLVLWTREIFFPKPPEEKTPETKITEALKDYLGKGIKVRSE